MKTRALLIVFLSVFFVVGYSQPKSKYANYIKKNTFSLNDNLCSNTSGFEKYNLFVIGERHGPKINNEALLIFLNYLNEEYGVNNLLLEEGFARVALINKFLETNDTSLIRFLKDYSIEQEINFIFKLKNYNDSLSLNNKVILHGIDYEQVAELPIVIYLLSYLIPEKKPPSKIADIIFKMRHANRLKFIDKKTLIKEIYNSFYNHLSCYKSYLGKEYALFKEAIDRWSRSKELQDFNYNFRYDSILFAKRERLIYENIEKIAEKNKGEKFLAKYGVGHIGLQYFLGIKARNKSLISLLHNSEDSYFHNKVASLIISYNSMFKSLSTRKLMGKDLHHAIKRIKPDRKINIIRLDDNNSPFLDVATNRFQYVIIYK